VKWNEAAGKYRSKTSARVLWFFVKWRVHLICFRFCEYRFEECDHKKPSENLSELAVLWDVTMTLVNRYIVVNNINIAAPSELAQRIDMIVWRASGKHTL
jgi:hypothetical protein